MRKSTKCPMDGQWLCDGTLMDSGNYWYIPTFEDVGSRPVLESYQCPHKWIDIEFYGMSQRLEHE